MSIPSYDFLDSDFHDLVNDLTCIYPPSVQNTLYTQILLHRWHSRILRLYSVADSFAAASVGARRSQNNIISNTLSQIEFSFALVLAKVSLNSNMNIWKSIKNNQGLNVPLDSINSRNATAIRFAQDYIERANVWSPEHAARASEQAKKMKKRKTKDAVIQSPLSSIASTPRSPSPPISTLKNFRLPKSPKSGPSRLVAEEKERNRRGSAETTSKLQSVLDESLSFIRNFK